MAHTLADLQAKEHLKVIKDFDLYESDEDENDPSKGPICTTYWVEGEGIKTMIKWPPQTEDDQQAIDELVDPTPVVVDTGPTIEQMIDGAETLDELKTVMKTLLGVA